MSDEMTDFDPAAIRAELAATLKALDEPSPGASGTSTGWQVPVPQPGSDEAVAHGCTCPVLDNGHGKGRADGRFWVNGDCPLHGFEP